MDAGNLKQEFEKMTEWSRCFIFDGQGTVIAEHKAPGLTAEALKDTTIGHGFTIGEDHFELHRFHPPLVYGRRGTCDEGEGISLARVIRFVKLGKRQRWKTILFRDMIRITYCIGKSYSTTDRVFQQAWYVDDLIFLVGELDSFIN